MPRKNPIKRASYPYVIGFDPQRYGVREVRVRGVRFHEEYQRINSGPETRTHQDIPRNGDRHNQSHAAHRHRHQISERDAGTRSQSKSTASATAAASTRPYARHEPNGDAPDAAGPANAADEKWRAAKAESVMICGDCVCIIIIITIMVMTMIVPVHNIFIKLSSSE